MPSRALVRDAARGVVSRARCRPRPFDPSALQAIRVRVVAGGVVLGRPRPRVDRALLARVFGAMRAITKYHARAARQKLSQKTHMSTYVYILFARQLNRSGHKRTKNTQIHFIEFPCVRLHILSISIPYLSVSTTIASQQNMSENTVH